MCEPNGREKGYLQCSRMNHPRFKEGYPIQFVPRRCIFRRCWCILYAELGELGLWGQVCEAPFVVYQGKGPKCRRKKRE